MKKFPLLNIVLLFICFSCNTPKLDGHYHLERDDNSVKFQTWNIKNNRMKINKEVCSETDSSCFTSHISFSKDAITINPWVDIEFTTKYSMDDSGIIYLEGEKPNQQFKLKRMDNCISSKDYFQQKLDTLAENFQLRINDYMFTNRVFPNDFKNELIIGPLKKDIFVMFNGQLISSTEVQLLSKNAKKEDLWVHVDQNMKVSDIIPVLKVFYDKNFEISFTTAENSENNEQLGILKKSITNFQKKESGFVLNSCEYCEKYPEQKIKSTFNAKVTGPNTCIIDGKETDFFQLRNQLARYLGSSRITRLNTQIQLQISSDLLFKDYLDLIHELDFVHTELYSITYYRGKNDSDQKWIHDEQWNYKFGKAFHEFPLRIQETFSH